MRKAEKSLPYKQETVPLVVDGAVNGVGLVTQTFGSVGPLFHSGRVQQYATFAVFGGLMFAAWLILL